MPKRESKADIHTFKERTIARIIDKKRELQMKERQEQEEEKAIDHRFRKHWIDSLKQKRAVNVTTTIDKYFLHATLAPTLANNHGLLLYKQQRMENDQQLKMLTQGLSDSSLDKLHIPRDAGQYTMPLHNLLTGTSKTASFVSFHAKETNSAAYQFLYKAASYQLSVGRLLRSPHIEDSQNLELVTSSGTSLRANVSELLLELIEYNKLKTPSDGKNRLPGLIGQILSNAVSGPAGFHLKSMYLHSVLSARWQDEVKNGGQAADKMGFGDMKGLYESLVEHCFVVGPARHALMQLLQSKSSVKGADNPDNFAPQTSISERIRSVLAASVLYSSEGNHSPELRTLLPSYCYPLGVDVDLLPEQEPASKSYQRTQTWDVPFDKTDLNRKPCKKLHVFFPSDQTIKEQPDESVLPHCVSMSPIMTSQTARSHLSVSFTDPANSAYTIQTTYTLCLISRFAFLNFVCATVAKVQESTSFLSFTEPLSEYDPVRTPLHPSLVKLKEFMTELRQVVAPIFPLLLRDHEVPESKSGSNDVHAFIPNTTFLVHCGGEDIGPYELRRTFYQSFYSAFPQHIQNPPDTTGTVRLYEKANASVLSSPSHRMERDREEGFFVLQWALPILLKYLPMDQIILVLGSAVLEMSIIVHHRDIQVVSGIILALINLLKPIKWCSPVIVSLPQELNDAIESPVPIIIGLTKLPPQFVLLERKVVIDPLERIVHLNPNDVIQSQSIFLPNGSRVVHALKTPAETILRLVRRQRRVLVKKLSLSSSFFKDRSPTLSSEKATGLGTTTDSNAIYFGSGKGKPAFPTLQRRPSSFNRAAIAPEIDLDAADYTELLGAIQQFSNIIYNHILAIVNTTIQIQRDERQQAFNRRRVLNPRKRNSNTKRESHETAGNAPVPMRSNAARNGATLALRNPPSNRNTAGLRESEALPASSIVPTGEQQSNVRGDGSHHHEDVLSDITFSESALEAMDDKESVGQAYSISSNASSLPSLQSNAPMLAVKEIGQSGLKFMKNFSETQMYSNYCQSLKNTADLPPNLDGSFFINALSPTAESLAADVNDASFFIREEIAEDDESQEEESGDSLVDIFWIALRGTIPLSKAKADACFAIYQEIYADSHALDADHMLMNGKLVKLPSALRQGNSSLLRRYIRDKVIKDYANKEQSLILDIPTLTQCNGLFCNGFCNTDRCGEICTALWESKMLHLRRRQAAFEIIAKQYEKSDQKIAFVSKKGVKLTAVKHGRETESQYQLRSSSILQGFEKSALPTEMRSPGAASKPTSLDQEVTPKAVNSSKKPKSIRSLSLVRDGHNKYVKKRTFAKTHDPYIQRLAHYFARKETKMVTKFQRHCYRRIQRFLFQYICYWRRKRLRQSVIYIQSIFRGNVVRNNMHVLVEMLFDRKISRLLAKIRIRNYVRARVERIYKAFQLRREIRAKQRRRLLSIPTASSFSQASISYSGERLTPVASTTPAPTPRLPAKFINEPVLSEISTPRSTSAVSESSGGLPSPRQRTASANAVPDRAKDFLQFGQFVRRRSATATINGPALLKRLEKINAKPRGDPATDAPQIQQLSLDATIEEPKSPHQSLVSALLTLPSPDITDTGSSSKELVSPNTFPMIPITYEDSSDDDDAATKTEQRLQRRQQRNHRLSRRFSTTSEVAVASQVSSEDGNRASVTHRPSESLPSDNEAKLSEEGSVVRATAKDAVEEDLQSVVGMAITHAKPLNTTDLPPPDLRSELSRSPHSISSKHSKVSDSTAITTRNVTPFGRYMAANNIALSDVVSRKAVAAKPPRLSVLPAPATAAASRSRLPSPRRHSSPVIAAPPTPEMKSPSDTEQKVLKSIPSTPSNFTSELGDDIEDLDVDRGVDDHGQNQLKSEEDDMQLLLKTNPLKTLGPTALDLMNRQQLMIITKMWNLLIAGVPVTKHSGKSAPKSKLLFCDQRMRLLYWRSPGASPDSEYEQEALDLEPTPNRRSLLFGRKQGNEHRRSTLTLAGADRQRHLLFKDMISVTDDCSSAVLRRSLSRGYLTNHHTNVISIIAATRTLDVEVVETCWGDLYRGLAILCNFYTSSASHDGFHVSDQELHYVVNKPQQHH